MFFLLRLLSTLSSTPDPVKTLPVLVVRVQSGVRLLMCLLWDVLTRLSGSCALVLERLLSVTSSLLPSVWLMNSSMPLVAQATATPSRRRTNLSVSPSLTVKKLTLYIAFLKSHLITTMLFQQLLQKHLHRILAKDKKTISVIVVQNIKYFIYHGYVFTV